MPAMKRVVMPGFLKKVFGRRKKSTSIPEALKEASAEGPKTVLERLRNYEDLFQRKQIHLEECIAKQVAEARKHGTKNKRGPFQYSRACAPKSITKILTFAKLS